MPIVNMLFDGDPIPEGATNVRPAPAQYQQGRPLRLYDTFVGLCIRESEQNGRDDSDFYMLVWNPTTQEPTNILFASTRGWSYPCYASHADATPEVLAAYGAYEARRAADLAAKHARDAARNPLRGTTVQVVRGRKVPRGTTGRVFWENIERRGFEAVNGTWYRPTGRIGIETADGRRVFTAASNVDVVSAMEG